MDWPGNSPDLNLIENLWNWMKDRLQELRVSSVAVLMEEIKKLWVQATPVELLQNLSDLMPKRIQMVLDANGDMTKY